MGLGKDDRRVLSSRAVKDEMFDSLIVEEVAARLFSYDDLQTIKDEKRCGPKIVLFCHLVEKRLSSLTELVDVLEKFGHQYEKLAQLVRPRIPYVAKNFKNTTSVFDSLQTLRYSIGRVEFMKMVLKEKLPVYEIAKCCFYCPDICQIFFTDNPELQKFTFPRIELSAIDKSVGCSVDDSVFDSFMKMAPELRNVERLSTIRVCMSEGNQKRLQSLSQFNNGYGKLSNINPVNLEIYSLAHQKQRVDISPVITAIANNFNCKSLYIDDDLNVKDAQDTGNALNRFDIQKLIVPGYRSPILPPIFPLNFSSIHINADKKRQNVENRGDLSVFCGALKDNKSIVKLKLTDSALTDQILEPLLDVLPTMFNLKSLTIRSKGVSMEFGDTLRCVKPGLAVSIRANGGVSKECGECPQFTPSLAFHGLKKRKLDPD